MTKKSLRIIGFIFSSLVLFSCWSDDIDNLSKEIVWEPGVALPLGKASVGFDDFSGFDTTLLELDTLSGYPYWIDTPYINLNSSMSFNFEGLTEEAEEINQLMFRLNFYNGFPVEVQAQGYFLDSYNMIIDSIFTESKLRIAKGNIIGNGEEINKTHTQKDVILDKNRIDELGAAQEFRIDISISNAMLDTSLIDYYPGYTLDIQVGIKADIKLDSIHIN